MITNVSVFGIEAAMRGMRNPMNSWHLGDTEGNVIGQNDMNLAKKLILGGAEHRKFLRMIHVQFDLNFPRYIWSEFDTYHFNVKNSCSTMHKLLVAGSPITRELFSCAAEDYDVLDVVITKLEEIRKQYVKKDCPNKLELLARAKKILPEGFLQLRTVDTNYEELANMYFQRRNHRLPEWREFCQWLIDYLPYFKEFVEATKNESNKER